MTPESWLKRKANGNGVAWNKGKKNPLFAGDNNPRWKGGNVNIACWECGGTFSVRPYRKDTAHFCSRECAAQYRNEGKRTADKKIRQSAKYKAWRTLVFERDDYTCRGCGQHGGYLHADHIKPFALYPELRFEVSNGRTLCVPCHKKTGTYGRGAIYRQRCIASA